MVLSFTEYPFILCFEYDGCTGRILGVLDPDECCFDIGGISVGGYGECYSCYY